MPAITGIPWLDAALNALAGFGYLIVFGATVFENLFVVGSVTPGETVVMAAAFVSSAGTGLTWWGVWLASVAGTIVGSNVSYWFGRYAGRDALIRVTQRAEDSWVGRVFKITPKSISDSEQYFIDHGAKTVLLARFAMGVKNFVPMIAGVGKMSLFWFEVYTLLGAVIYTTAMVAIGYVVGDNFQLALRLASSIGWIGLLVIAGVVVAVLWGRRQAKFRRAEAAQAASVADETSEMDGAADEPSGATDAPDEPSTSASAAEESAHATESAGGPDE